MKKTGTLKKTGVVLGSSVLTLLIMEIGVRVLDVPPRPLAALPFPSYRLSENPVIRYEFRPGYKPTDQPFSKSHIGYSINSAGFRDYETEEAKPEGTFRIAILGDSTTAGNGIPDVDNTYPKILERLLNGDDTAGMHYEVLNMGVGGYHTMQEVETLRVNGLKFRPDLVVVTFAVNDFALHGDGGVYRRLRNKNPLSVPNANSALYNQLLWRSRLMFILHHRLNLSKEVDDKWYRETALKGQSTVKAGLSLLSELQQKHGFRSLMVLLPEFRVPFDQYKSGATHKKAFKEAEGISDIAVIDLLDRFVSLGVDAETLSFDGAHMNEYGHQKTAEVLLPIIREKVEAAQQPHLPGVGPASP
jgi:lysophospholipase L1-like esterase